MVCILNGIRKRFDHCFQDRELRIAALIHLCFKMTWIPKEDLALSEEILREEFEAIEQVENTQSVTNSRYG